MSDFRNDYTDPSNATPGKRTVSYPTPHLSDLIVIEQIDIRPENYEPLPVGTPHPMNEETGRDLQLVWQGPATGNDAFKAVRRIYASSRLCQNAYNASQSYDADSKAHPIFQRSYVMLREDYANEDADALPVRNQPLGALIQVTVEDQGAGYTDATEILAATGTATFRPIIYGGKITAVHILTEGTDYTEDLSSTLGGLTIIDTGGGAGAVITARVQPQSAVLVKEEMQQLGDPQLNALFVAVTRIYQTLPGYTLLGKATDSFGGDVQTFQSLVAPDTEPVDVVVGIEVGSALVTAGGAGYDSTVTAAITGGGGTGATATVQKTGTVVTGVTITNGGSGFTSAPTITISAAPGHGTGATALAQLTGIPLTQELQQVSSTMARLQATIREVGVIVDETQKCDGGVPGSKQVVSTYLVLAISPIPPDSSTSTTSTTYERRQFGEDPHLRVEVKTVYTVPESFTEYRSATRPMPGIFYAAALNNEFGWVKLKRDAYGADVTLQITHSFSTTLVEPTVDVIQETSFSLPFGLSGSGLVSENTGAPTVDPVTGQLTSYSRSYALSAPSGAVYSGDLDPSTPSLEVYLASWVGTYKIMAADVGVWRAGIYKTTVIRCLMQ